MKIYKLSETGNYFRPKCGQIIKQGDRIDSKQNESLYITTTKGVVTGTIEAGQDKIGTTIQRTDWFRVYRKVSK